MNARAAKKMIVVVALAGAAAGCAGSGAADQARSPLEPRIAELVDANRHYPRWADFPAAPTDLPTDGQLAARVNTLRVTSGALAGEAARIEWLLGDPEAFEATVRQQVRAAPVSPDAARTQQELDGFAQGLRERGRAPPPVDRPR